jgi:hypothetical protein
MPRRVNVLIRTQQLQHHVPPSWKPPLVHQLANGNKSLELQEVALRSQQLQNVLLSTMLAHVLLECVNGNKSLALTEEFVLKSSI